MMMNKSQHQQDQDDEESRAATGWRLDRKIPITILALIVGQTVAGVWSMSRLVGQVDQLKEQITEFRNERYTRDDAKRDKELWQSVVQSLQQAGYERDRRLNVLEAIAAADRTIRNRQP